MPLSLHEIARYSTHGLNIDGFPQHKLLVDLRSRSSYEHRYGVNVSLTLIQNFLPNPGIGGCCGGAERSTAIELQAGFLFSMATMSKYLYSYLLLVTVLDSNCKDREFAVWPP